LIDFGVLSLLIRLGVLFVLIYQVDRIWSRINVDKYPRSIRVDKFWSRINMNKYPRNIKMIEFGVVST
jgi:hypothetical protein